MIPGYNHNVKYKDKVYHVQTEDSGVQSPHVITHLFVGGNIVESRKTSYAELVDSMTLSTQLVEIMQAQHKGMLKDLIGGKFDAKIAERSKNAATLNGPAPLNVDAGAQHRSSFGLPVDSATAKQVATRAAVPTPAPAPIAKPVQPSAGAYAKAATSGAPVKSDPNPFTQAPRPPPGPVGKPPAQPVAQAPAPIAAKPPALPPQPRPVAPAPQAQAQSTPPTFGGLPPKSSTTLPRANAPAAITRPVPAPAPIAAAPPMEDVVLEAETLARAFESKDESAVDSIFGEDLISEKSLDEVILSYLADDLQKE